MTKLSANMSLGLLLLFSACILLAFTACGRDNQYDTDTSLLWAIEEGYLSEMEISVSDAPIHQTAYVEVGRGTFEVSVPHNFYMTFINRRYLSFERDGLLKAYHVEVGQRVRAGDILAELYPSEMSPIAQGRHNIRRQNAVNELERFLRGFAEEKDDRWQEIFYLQESIVDDHEQLVTLEVLMSSFDRFVQNGEDTRIRLEQQLADIDEVVEREAIYAPMDGIISWVRALGTMGTVQGGQHAITLVDDESIHFYLPMQFDRNEHLTEYEMRVFFRYGRRIPVFMPRLGGVEFDLKVVNDAGNTGTIHLLRFYDRQAAEQALLEYFMAERGIEEEDFDFIQKIISSPFSQMPLSSLATQVYEDVMYLPTRVIHMQQVGADIFRYVFLYENGIARRQNISIGTLIDDMRIVSYGLQQGQKVIIR